MTAPLHHRDERCSLCPLLHLHPLRPIAPQSWQAGLPSCSLSQPLPRGSTQTSCPSQRPPTRVQGASQAHLEVHRVRLPLFPTEDAHVHKGSPGSPRPRDSGQVGFSSLGQPLCPSVCPAVTRPFCQPRWEGGLACSARGSTVTSRPRVRGFAMPAPAGAVTGPAGSRQPARRANWEAGNSLFCSLSA